MMFVILWLEYHCSPIWFVCLLMSPCLASGSDEEFIGKHPTSPSVGLVTPAPVFWDW